MIAALLAVAVLSAAALGYVYQITKEPIARAKDQKTLDAIREVVGTFDNNPFAEKTTIATPDGKSELELYPARENGIVTSVAIKTFSDNGFGGRIELIIGMLMDGTVTGYKVIEQKETRDLAPKSRKVNSPTVYRSQLLPRPIQIKERRRGNRRRHRQPPSARGR